MKKLSVFIMFFFSFFICVYTSASGSVLDSNSQIVVKLTKKFAKNDIFFNYHKTWKKDKVNENIFFALEKEKKKKGIYPRIVFIKEDFLPQLNEKTSEDIAKDIVSLMQLEAFSEVNMFYTEKYSWKNKTVFYFEYEALFKNEKLSWSQYIFSDEKGTLLITGVCKKDDFPIMKKELGQIVSTIVFTD